MKPETIYFGDIMKVKDIKNHTMHSMVGFGIGFSLGHHEVDADIHKKKATLIEVVEGRNCYVDIDNIKTIFDLWKIKRSIHKDGSISLKGPIMVGDSLPFFQQGDLYVERKTLQQNTEIKKDISIWQLKKQMKKK